ncbi:hypothetical protein SORBI_3010G100516 [Sorghum bicolor]|uniref:Uncharacterized protein n=1 Tax=Sorghum bicolor TaxID=4558 RepID=A0A1W0VS94_SORBI|nr:hypothetical protein SORBI_3010G100516 [Sorghum bicolor]
MARTMLPSPSPQATVKREIDDAEPSAYTPAPPPPPRKKRRLPVTPTQLPLSPPLLTPQTIPSVASEGTSLAGLTPTPAGSAVKVEPGADAGDGGHRRAAGEPNESPDPRSVVRPAAAEPPTLWLNRRRLGQILHELAGAHEWRDAASVVSTLLSGNRRVDSYEDTRRMFVVAMEIHKRLAEDSGVQHGVRSSYYLRTQKLFNVWMRKLIWFPSCPKKNLVTLELALFYLSQGNIDNAHIATRTLIAKGKLQTEPILNLVHGLISFDKWYSGLPKDMQVEDFDVYDESCGISMKSNGSEGTDLLDHSYEDSMDIVQSSLASCSSESSINNENVGRKMNNKPGFVHPKEEIDPLESQANENLRSIFLDTSDGPTCGLEQSLLPLKLKFATGASNDSFYKYMKYKSVPNTLYEDAEKCLRLALYSNPPVMAALLPLIQILLLGDKLKDALNELEKACLSSTTALPFRLRGRLLEEYDQNQVSTISSCYEEALRRDPTCSYSMERLIKMHRKGDCKLLAAKAACAAHLFGPEFPYVKAVGSYIAKQEALDEISILVRNKQNSVRLLETLEKLT